MKLSNFAVVLGVAAAMMSISSHADDHRKKSRGNHRVDSSMNPSLLAQSVGSQATAGVTSPMHANGGQS